MCKVILTRDKSFYRTFAKLALTLMLEQAVILSVNLADNLMLGAYSEASLSGVAAVNQIQFVLQQVAYALGNGMIVLASQYWGQKRLKEIRQLSSIALRGEILLSLLLFALVSLFPAGTLRLFTSQPMFISEGVKYLRIIRFSYLFFTLTAVLLSTMRVVEQVKIALQASLLALYDISERTRELAGAYMLIQSVVLFTMSYQMPVNTGIIRGGGDTRFAMILDLVSIWGIVMPVSLLCAFVWKLSPIVVIIALNSDQVFKCIPACIRVNSYKWVRKLTRA